MSEKPADDSLTPEDASPASASSKPAMLGKFRLLSTLGKGSMGKVLRAEDTKLKRHVALKVLRTDKSAKTYRSEQFIREARSAAKLEHPSIVQIYEVGDVAGYHYIAMELIEGGSLGSMIKATGPLDLLRACQLTAEAAEALAYASQLGITHRDIKPENLMLTRAGRCKITDFGLASIDDPTDDFAMPKGPVGTPAYMAPEVIAAKPATAKSDVYSLACVLFYLLTGKPPFQSKDRTQLLRMHLDSPPPDITSLRPDLPESLAEVLNRALAKNPDDRPSPDTFAKQLRAHTIPVGGSGSHLSNSASSPFLPSLQPTASNKKSHLLLYGALAFIAALLIVAITLFLMNNNRPQPAAAQNPPPQSQPVVIQLPPPQPAASQPVAVAVAPTPVPIPAPAPAPAFIKVSDTAALLAAAQSDKKITLLATPSSVTFDTAEKLATISFDENPNFKILYSSRLYAPMTKKFGGKFGDGLLHKPLLFTGTPTLIDNHPQLTLTSSTQIEPASP